MKKISIDNPDSSTKIDQKQIKHHKQQNNPKQSKNHTIPLPAQIHSYRI
jgi:hypothetical protein